MQVTSIDRENSVAIDSATPLTLREQECLTWVCRGLRNKQVAARLGLSTATVEFHLSNARQKLRALTREHAVAKAVQLGLVAP